MKAEIVASEPVFLYGLKHALSAAGAEVIQARMSAADGPDPTANAVLVQPGALPSPTAHSYIQQAVRRASTFVISTGEDERAIEHWLHMGVLGAIDKKSDVNVFTDTVMTVASPLLRGSGWLRRPAEPNDTEGGEGRVPRVLSSREHQVVTLLSEGLTHFQVGHRLGISHHTVDTYVKRIRAKLGVGNKADLVRVALLDRYSGQIW